MSNGLTASNAAGEIVRLTFQSALEQLPVSVNPSDLIPVAAMKKIGRGAVIRIGSLLVPSERLADSLARFTKLLFCLTNSDAHPYAFRGSATALRHRDRHLLFCCNHQIADVAPRDVVIPVDKHGRTLVSGSRFIQLSARPELAGEEMLDVCAMHFDPANYAKTELERGFFDIKGADVWNGEPQTTFLVFGYPTRLRNLIVDGVSGALAEIKVKMTATSAVYQGKSNAQGVHAIKLTRSGKYSSDGLSGGAVFHVAEDAKGYYCGLAGIVLRGSDTSDIIHFMDARLIQQFFQHQATLSAGS